MARKLTKLETFGLIAAVITGSMYFYLDRFYDPQQAALKQAQEQLNRSVRQFNELQAIVPAAQLQMQLQSRQENLAKLRAELGALDISLAEGLQGRALTLQWVYQQLDVHGLRLLSVAPKGARQLHFNWEIYQLSLAGGFSGLLAFMQAVAAHEQPILLDFVTVEKNQTHWSVNISLELWVLSGV